MAVSQAAGELQVALTDLDRARKSIERALKADESEDGRDPEPRWRMQYRRQWKLLSEVRDAVATSIGQSGGTLAPQTATRPAQWAASSTGLGRWRRRANVVA